MIRVAYSFFLYLLTPLILLRLWYRGKKAPDYRKRIAERFGVFDTPKYAIDVWFHAVSLGEVIATIPMIESMLAKNYTIAVTTMTPTGSNKLVSHFGNRVFHVYLPIDTPSNVKRFLKKLKPQVGIIMETEIWPNLIYYCSLSNLPLIVANARLSVKSYNGYRKIKYLIQPLLKKLSLVIAQSEDDGERFCQLGLPQRNLSILGNVKFDVDIGKVNHHLMSQIRTNIGLQRIIIIAASTHDGEEKQLLTIYSRLRKKYSQCLLIIAPRHPERFDSVNRLCSGYVCVRRSALNELSDKTEILLVDSLGELLTFYALSDIAFVGGSLKAIGGHNVLEPMALGVPVITGPHLFNFKHITKQLIEAKAMIIAKDTEALYENLNELIANQALRKQLEKSASIVLNQNQGIVEKYVELILRYLKR
jgi:3-deoxy-D-manno-octulosonic-acid transferase